MKQSPEILEQELSPENALRFYCPQEDGTFTFIYQKNGKVYPFSAKLPEEQNNDLDNMKQQFAVFAESLFLAIQTWLWE